jgi:hypothetical protein
MLQLNFKVDLPWFMSHLHDTSIPITIVHGLHNTERTQFNVSRLLVHDESSRSLAKYIQR